MKDLSKKELELFEYYKEQTKFINKNSKLKIVKDFLSNIEDTNIKNEEIEYFIKTPIFNHLCYKTKSNLYIVQYEPYATKYTYDNYEQFIESMFLSDREQENPLYGIIKGLARFYIEEFQEKYERHKIKNKIKKF